MLLLLALSLPRNGVAINEQVAAYVGGQICAACHEEEYASWAGSHHDLAMQEATEKSVLGDFSKVNFEWFGVTSTFFRRGDEFVVTTDGPDGVLRDYPIAYTFGVYPLQQYLIRFPGGRLQTLDISWDSRPAAQGGQRWFHTHPEDAVRHDDVLHWTGPNMNWNYMCADCHSTNLKKGYDQESATYETTWSEINVSCEACHGPGSIHVALENSRAAGQETADRSSGLTTRLDGRRDITWTMDAETGTAQRSTPGIDGREIEVCARCHSRRAQLTDDHQAGDPFFDAYRPSMLREGLYHADGQMEDEVYVWGSFRQSAMYHAGVTCSDCHDPHTTSLRVDGEAVCYQCHDPARFATPDHHLHKEGTTGASCIECHMPAKNYMVVDPRHDHSFRIPRPDLTDTLGTPNACNVCHEDETAQWATEQLENAFGKNRKGRQQYAATFASARQQLPGAGRRLVALLGSQDLPTIARATALSHLGNNPDPRMIPLIRTNLSDADPLVRLGALNALQDMGSQERILAYELLDDDVKSVRIEAASLLAGIPLGATEKEVRTKIERGFAEYIETQEFNSDRPESQTNLGGFYFSLGDAAKAERAYREALKLQPKYIPARVNLAQLFSTYGREDQTEKLLREGLAKSPENAALHHALGLSLIRQGNRQDATTQLAAAARLEPANPRYHFVYGIALNSQGLTTQAITVLSEAHQRNPGDTDILFALATIFRDAGDSAEALRYARKLDKLLPGQPEIRQLVLSLESNAD